jgi:hypothetical protein
MTDLALIPGLAAMFTDWSLTSMHDCQHVPISRHVTPSEAQAQQPKLEHAYCMATTRTLVERGVPKP